MKRAERALLSVRIGQTVRKLDNLSQKREQLKQEVFTRLPRKKADVEKFVETLQVQKHMEVNSDNKTSLRQIRTQN